MRTQHKTPFFMSAITAAVVAAGSLTCTSTEVRTQPQQIVNRPTIDNVIANLSRMTDLNTVSTHTQLNGILQGYQIEILASKDDKNKPAYQITAYGENGKRIFTAVYNGTHLPNVTQNGSEYAWKGTLPLSAASYITEKI